MMELWDIYPEDRVKTGRTMVRNDFHMGPNEFHITVLGVVQHTDGSFLITQRVMTKAWAAGHWEVSGGGVQAGEEPVDAVKREVLEETGLDVSKAEGGSVFSYKRVNPDEGDNYFVDIYRFVLDFKEEDLKLQTEETMGYKLATKEEIAELGKQKIFLHYDSIKQVFDL